MYRNVSIVSRLNNHPMKDTKRTNENILEYGWRYNRGLPIRIRKSVNISRLYCICPPAYYGNKCQYQNQRISLTIQIRVSSDWHSVFLVLITLIDNERNIQLHDYLEYLPILDCNTKFNIYLLYPTRPKNLSQNYSIQIDVFNQVTMTYRASWIFPLHFPFLPVHHLPVLLKIPTSSVKSSPKYQPYCIHGECIPYISYQDKAFCRCYPGWSGLQCNIIYTCMCAAGSICISDSICVCTSLYYTSRRLSVYLSGGI